METPRETPETSKTWNVAYLAARILALYLVAQALVQLARQGSYAFASVSESWPQLASIGGLALAGGVVWLIAPRLADEIWVGATGAESPLNVPPLDLQRIAFGVVGLLIVTETIPRIVSFVGDIIVQNTFSDPFRAPEQATTSFFTATDVANIIANIVSLAIGLWLLFGSRALVDIVQRYRRPDLDRLRQLDEQPPEDAD